MSLADILTPKNTEEVKPGLFFKKTGKGYRQVTPMAWNGKINWFVVVFGSRPIKHLFIFLLIMFLVWSYKHDVKEYQNFYNATLSDPMSFCQNVTYQRIVEYTTPSGLNLSSFTFDNGNTDGIQDIH